MHYTSSLYSAWRYFQQGILILFLSFIMVNGTSAQDLKATLIYPANGYSYQSGNSFPVTVLITNEGGDVLQSYDSVSVRFFLDGNPLALTVSGVQKNSFLIVPPYAIYPGDTAGFTFQLPQASFVYDSTLAGNKDFCVEVDLVFGTDSIRGNNTSCNNITLAPQSPGPTPGERPRIYAIDPPAAGNGGTYAINVSGANLPANAQLKLTRAGHADIVVPDSFRFVTTGGDWLGSSMDLQHADTGLWNVVVTIPGDTIMTLPLAFRVFPVSLHSVFPPAAANRDTVSLRIFGAGYPLFPYPTVRLIGAQDTIQALYSYYGAPDSSFIFADIDVTSRSLGDYHVEVTIQGMHSLYLVNGFSLTQSGYVGKRKTDVGMTNIGFTPPRSMYKAGDTMRITGRFRHNKLPVEPPLHTTDSVSLSFSLDGIPWPVTIDGRKDSIHVVQFANQVVDFYVFTFPTGFFTYDSAFQGSRSFCATIRGLSFDDTVATNNTACQTIMLMAPPPTTSLRPQISSVYPAVVSNVGVWPVTIAGARMASAARLKLVRAGYPDVIAIDSLTDIANGGWTMNTSLNLQGVDTGVWDVVVTIPGDTVMTLPGALRVAPMQITLTSPEGHINRGIIPINILMFGLPPNAATEVLLINRDTITAMNTVNQIYPESAVINTTFNLNGQDTGLYDIVVVIPGIASVRQPACFRIDQRPPADSIISDLSVKVDSATLHAGVTESTMDIQLSIRNISGDTLLTGDSMLISFSVNGTPLILTIDGRTDSAFFVQLDRMLHWQVGGDFIWNFSAGLPSSYNAGVNGPLCVTIQGSSFTDIDTSNNTACRAIRQIIAPRHYSILPGKVGNLGITKLIVYGLGLTGQGQATIKRPGHANWFVGFPPFSWDAGRKLTLDVNFAGAAPGVWNLELQFPDTVLSIPFEIVEPEILSVSPNRFGKVGNNDASFTLRIHTAGISPQAIGGITLKNGAKTMYAQHIGCDGADSSLFYAVFNMVGSYHDLGDYDLTILSNPSGRSVTIPNAFRLEQSSREQPQLFITGPAAARTGALQTYAIHIFNPSNVEVSDIIVPYGTTHDSVFVRGISLPQVPADSFDGRPLNDGKAGVLLLDKIGPQQTRIVYLDAVTHGSPTGPAVLKAGVFSLETSLAGATESCLRPILQDLPEVISTIPPGCLQQELQKADTPALSDYAHRVAVALGTCTGLTDTDSLRNSITKLLAVRTRIDTTGTCDSLFVQESRFAISTELLWSYDPNDKHGPTGAGQGHYLNSETRSFPYLVNFENDSAAKAAAQIVRVVDTLDKDVFDLGTFRLGDIKVADSIISIPDDLSFYTGYIDFRSKGKNYVLKVDAGLDLATGVASWTLTTLDPQTMVLTTDPYEGFLPPNRTSPEGQGSVNFYIDLKSGLPDDTRIRNKAYIYFDVNDPIITNEFSNTIDLGKPASQVDVLPHYITNDTTVRITWTGTDTGSGVQHYSVYVSENGGPFQEWIQDTTGSEAIFTGQYDATYAFYSVATDSVGNREHIPLLADAKTRFINCAEKLSVSLDTTGNTVFCEGSQVTLRVNGGQHYLWNDKQEDAEISITESGIYYVTVTDTFGCVWVSDTTEITVLPLPRPPAIHRGGDTLYSSYSYGNQWYKDGVMLQHFSNAACPLTGNGNYHVTHTDSNGCTAVSDIIRIEKEVSLADGVTGNDRIRVYPNPAEVFIIEGPAAAQQNISVSLFNMQGQLLREEQIRVNGDRFVHLLDLSGYASGNYWINVQSGSVYYSGKITKQ